MKEAEFQQQVISLAKMYGWKVQHSRAVQTASGRWMTPIAGDAGFPDLVLVKSNFDHAENYTGKGGIIYAELKTAIGKVAEHQYAWIDALELAGGECYVWRPGDLALITERLSGLRRHLKVTL
jgi:hypothetical protein